MTDTTGTTKTATTVTATATTEPDSEDTKKPGKEKEIPVIYDQGFFQHNTGDTYDGFFEAKKKDRMVKMHGQGVYTTAEGDRYTGNWDSDKFGGNDEVVISYADGSKYEGIFRDWSYTSKGRYSYPDGSVLQCEFAENCPVGNLKLTDPNGHSWLGKADQGFAWLEPVNHFFEFLESTRAQGRINRRRKHVQSSESVSKPKHGEYNLA